MSLFQCFRSASRRLVLTALISTLAACGGRSDDDSGGVAAPVTISPTSSASTASKTASAHTALTGTVQGTAGSLQNLSQDQVQSLVKDWIATKFLAKHPQFLSSDIVLDETVDCAEFGSFQLTGNATLEYSTASDDTSLEGSAEQIFSNCTDAFTVQASDGACELTVTMDGAFDMTINASYTSAIDRFVTTLSLSSTDPVTLYINGEGHDLEVNLDTFSVNDSEPTFSGTVSLDDDDFEADEQPNTLFFTGEDLGCGSSGNSSSDDDEE